MFRWEWMMPGGRFRSLEDPETLRQFVANLREGIYITNQAGEILDANPACLEILGVSSLEELRLLRAQELFADPSRRAEETARLAREGSVKEFELALRRPDGEERTVLDTCHSVQDPDTGEVLYHGILVDITPRKQLERSLQEQSLRDPLTGCLNRRFLKEAEKRLQTCDAWGAIMVDVDNFKQYNDEHGHQEGDEVLMRVGHFLQQNARAGDAVVRMGGDEFLLLLLEANSPFVAKVGRRLREAAVAQGLPPFSVGWATGHGAQSLEETIDHADRELLQIRLFERLTREKQARGRRRSLYAERVGD
jgi:diguanylate cyclase (GGDEF)-like protein/PAS domain S-box-containing protein